MINGKRDYQELDQRLSKRHTLKVSNNTYLNRRPDDCIAMRYHGTDVVLFKPDGSRVLNTGGWFTYTTKERMNWFLPDGMRIYQDQSIWYLYDYIANKTLCIYRDGIVIGSRGGIKGGRSISATSISATKKTKALKRKIKRYADTFIEKLDKGEIPAPSLADCIGCSMVAEDGSHPLAKGCVKLHVRESYYVPSLLVRAIKAMPVSQVAMWFVGDRWGGRSEGDTLSTMPWSDEIATEQLTKSLRRFIYREHGLAA